MSTSVEVTYLYHSGYMIKVADTILVFDYYPGSPEEEQNFDFVSKRIENDNIKRVVFFASHNHRDHFDKKIFSFCTENKKFQYILSDEIKVKTENTLHVKPYDEILLDDILVNVYGSTDEGVSFYVKLHNVGIFHAGDLNWWHWFYESTSEELNEYEKDFKNEISKLKDINIDVAMFPVDPRLKEFYWLGGAYFLEKISTRYFFPMHFGTEYAITGEFKNKIKNKNVYVIESQRQIFYPDITA